MKKQIFISLVAMVISLPMSAQQFEHNNISLNGTEMGLLLPVANTSNVFASPTRVAPTTATPSVSSFSLSSANSIGQVFSSDLFKVKTTGRTSGAAQVATDGSSTNYRSIASISAYQNGGATTTASAPKFRRSGSAPPPTPPIDEGNEGDKLPLGDALLPLLLLILTYAALLYRRQKA